MRVDTVGLGFGALVLAMFGWRVAVAYLSGVVGQFDRRISPGMFWFGLSSYSLATWLGVFVIFISFGLPDPVGMVLAAALMGGVLWAIKQRPSSKLPPTDEDSGPGVIHESNDGISHPSESARDLFR